MAKVHETCMALVQTYGKCNLGKLPSRNCYGYFAQPVLCTYNYWFYKFPFFSHWNVSCRCTVTIERFSNDCCKTNTKVSTPTNYNRSSQRDEPIRMPWQLSGTCVKLREKSRVQGGVAMIALLLCRFWFCVLLVGFKPIAKHSNRISSFDSHLKTAPKFGDIGKPN